MHQDDLATCAEVVLPCRVGHLLPELTAMANAVADLYGEWRRIHPAPASSPCGHLDDARIVFSGYTQ